VAECQGAARDKIARYLGVGKTTIDRAEAVVKAAEEEPTVDKIVDGQSLRKPQNAPICYRCARRAESKRCK
jgi:hypothetical protein